MKNKNKNEQNKINLKNEKKSKEKIEYSDDEKDSCAFEKQSILTKKSKMIKLKNYKDSNIEISNELKQASSINQTSFITVSNNSEFLSLKEILQSEIIDVVDKNIVSNLKLKKMLFHYDKLKLENTKLQEELDNLLKNNQNCEKVN